MHFVLLPPEPGDASDEPTAIIASRLEPPYNDSAGPGVQQILLLPKVNKACVLCNNTLSIYSLPELSPDSTFKPISCLWVGGVDLNEEDDDSEGVSVVIGLKKRLRLVHISENSPPRAIKAIEYGGCLISVRRDTFSCAADSHSYALLDIENQQKIGLFPISSLDPEASDIGGAAESLASAPQGPSRSVSSASTQPRQEDQRGHARSTSLNVLGLGSPATRAASPRPPGRRYGFDVPESLSRDMSPSAGRSPARISTGEASDRTSSQTRTGAASSDKPLPPPPPAEDIVPQIERSAPQPPSFTPLRPLVASPTPNEFLLTVGTTPSEQGVGMFVNLDGDMCRGSIQFSSYPDAIVVDGSGIDMAASLGPDMDAEEGYVLAVVRKRLSEEDVLYGIEIQRWDVDPGAGEAPKEWMNFSSFNLPTRHEGTYVSVPLGMRTVNQPHELLLPEIGQKLSVQQLHLSRDSSLSASTSQTLSGQAKADREFADRLSKLQARTVVWAGDQIWWTVRNPLLIRLDSRLEAAQYVSVDDRRRIQPNRSLLERVLGDIRGQEPRDESEYLSLIYIRQKASLMLFMDVVLRTKMNIVIFESEKRITEQALIDGEVDPRVVLSLLPILNKEVVQGPEGIQISGGITALIQNFLEQNDLSTMPADINGPFGDNLLHFVKRYLQFWKRQKGMASITNDPYVFKTIDAALLHILLLLDQGSPDGTSSPGTHRVELNELVDKEVECFDRAVELLEQFKRLYLLSRLYQSNCKAAAKASKVLATWKRIIEGEEDRGGELVDGEQRLREYLSRIRDLSIVEEYGTWLANRNPKLGVQVFADDQSRVKFEPTRAVALLREKAPGAIKEYLEYLVFGKKVNRNPPHNLWQYLTR